MMLLLLHRSFFWQSGLNNCNPCIPHKGEGIELQKYLECLIVKHCIPIYFRWKYWMTTSNSPFMGQFPNLHQFFISFVGLMLPWPDVICKLAKCTVNQWQKRNPFRKDFLTTRWTCLCLNGGKRQRHSENLWPWCSRGRQPGVRQHGGEMDPPCDQHPWPAGWPGRTVSLSRATAQKLGRLDGGLKPGY